MPSTFSAHEELDIEDTILDQFEKLSTAELNCCESISEDENNSIPESSVEPGGKPKLSEILGMESIARVSMLRKRIMSLESKRTLTRIDSVWLFALCAAVDTPLDADTSAALRSLLRKCASLRAERSDLDDEVVMLNILATICGRYFGQSEN